MKYSTVTQISKRIYELFVVNTAAAGIQQSNGAYLTKYIPVTPTLIENMIRSYGSMGCYQQGMNTGYIKWICFDFDCKNKETPDVVNLDRNIVSQLTNILDKRRIFYVKEFSGRRGIHVYHLVLTQLFLNSFFLYSSSACHNTYLSSLPEHHIRIHHHLLKEVLLKPVPL